MRRWVLRLPTQMDLPERHRWNLSHPTAMVPMTWPGISGSGAAIGTGSMLYPAREQECVLGQRRSERELGSGGSRCAKTRRQGRIVSLQSILLRELPAQCSPGHATRYWFVAHRIFAA